MKRILKACTVGTAISMFFTGCGSSSLVSGSGGGYQEIKWQVIETQETKENLGSEGLKEGETLAVKEMPDFYEEQSAEKTADTEIQSAFKIKDGHSDDTRDIESFHVGALQKDGTFIYSYITKLGILSDDADHDDRPIVHCVAAYNYKTNQFKVIHENAFMREQSNTGEDSESFYLQMGNSDGTGDIFVYDCGFGYLYDSRGEKTFETSIEAFVRKHFKGYSVVTTQAIMEGGDRIYIDLVIEKEEITSVDESLDEDEGSEEDADKEAEDLDKEFDDKTIEVVLVYDFQEYDSSIDQANQMLDTQAAWWKLLGESFEGGAGEEPSVEEHWKIAVETFPNQWGPAFLYGLSNWSENELADYNITDSYISGTPVFQWIGEKQFEYREDGYVSTFKPKEGTYKPFIDLKNNMNLEDVFVLQNGRYYELFGMIGNDLGEGDYYSVSFNRTFTRKDEEAKDDGTTEIHDISVTQTISKNRKRDAYPTNSYLEGYWIMDNCDSVFDVADEDVFCIIGKTEDDKEYDVINWLKPDGTTQPICSVESDTMIDIFKDNGSLYMTVAYEGWTSIEKLDNETKELEGSVGIYAEEISNVMKAVEYKSAEVDSKYHEQYDKMSSEDNKATLGENGGNHLDGNNVLHVNLSNTHKDLLQQIEEYKLSEIMANHKDHPLDQVKQFAEYIDAEKISDVGSDGYLLTSFAHGLLYFDKFTRKSISLDDGTWYGTWRFGDNFVSVGFSSSNSSYDSLDIAHSGVYEYNLDDIYKKALEEIVESTNLAFGSLEKEESEGAKKMREDLEEKRKDEEVVFVTPKEEEWKENTPGGELQSIEENRQKEMEKERKAREEAGEWDPVDEYFYGDDRLGNNFK